jgi:hypothetical protein
MRAIPGDHPLSIQERWTPNVQFQSNSYEGTRSHNNVAKKAGAERDRNHIRQRSEAS